MQLILIEQEYTDLKELADNAENFQSLYNELLSKHLALKDKHAKLLVFGVSSNNEILKKYQHHTNNRESRNVN